MSSFQFILKDTSFEVTAKKENNKIVVKFEDDALNFESFETNRFQISKDEHKYIIAVATDAKKIYVDIDSVLFELIEPTEDNFAGGAGGHEGEKDKIYAPMPGKIVKLLVKEGDEVTEKQPMVIVEAMKMENQVNSKANGKVKAINFAPGDQVDTDSPIIELTIE